MVSLKEGDSVVCRIKDGAIVKPTDYYDQINDFVIVSTDNYGYYLYIPSYVYLNGSSCADAVRCKQLGIASRFIGEQIIYITDSLVLVERKQDGLCCSRCTDFFLMAVANQPDGKTFTCLSCRQNPYR